MLKRVLGMPKIDRFDPTTDVFPPINVDKIASDLRLEQAGSDRGAKDLPGPDDHGFDSVEHRIIDAIDALRHKGLDHYHQHQKVYAERLARASESRVEVETIAGDAETDFQAEVKIWNAIMANQRKMVSVAGTALERFYERNRIEGAAQDGSGWPKFLGLAAFMIVIESFGNGLLFREASMQGLLGGFVIAVAISVLNVGFASLTGILARGFHHVRWLRRLLALIPVTVIGALICAVNLAAAHFRDAATGNQDGMEAAARAALSELQVAPHVLDSLQSWLLVGLGLLIAIAAGWKAHGIDDPYPGFGRVWRQMTDARVGYAGELEKAVEHIVEARDEAVARLREESGAARDRIEEAFDSLAGQGSLRGRLSLFLELCDQRANHLLAIYRDANRAARTAEPPAHFAERFTFAPFVADQVDGGVMDAAKREQEEISIVISSAIDKIFGGAKEAIDSYPETHELEEQTLAGTALKAAKANPIAAEASVVEIAKRRNLGR